MMWDFGGHGHELALRSRTKSQSRSPQPAPMRLPSPSFPIAVPSSTGATVGSNDGDYISSSYPPTRNGYLTIPGSHASYSPVQSTSSTISQIHTPPQVIYIHRSKHHSSNHKRRRSHSQSQPHAPPFPMPMPSPVTPSTSYPPTSPHVHFSGGKSPIPHGMSYPSSSSSPPGALVFPGSSGNALYNPRQRTHSHSQIDSTFQYSKCTGRKRALCIGINYHGHGNELRGCVNDAKRVRDFLIRHGGYKSSEIVLLIDETNDPRILPTRHNILDAMRWLVQGARENDSLFLHYSGHGGQVPDRDGVETGWDEAIFPMDFKKSGPITDHEMHSIMVHPLPAGCRLTGLFDACHSGTVLDLPYSYSSHGRLRSSHISSHARAKKASRADVISWSGCNDDQTRADTFSGGLSVGAMSNAFITSLTSKPHQTYMELLQSVRSIMSPRFKQRPQLGSSHHVDTSLQFVF